MTTGKWRDPKVPHKGWSCFEIFDAGKPDRVCQMCEQQQIRYVHVMKHPDYLETLNVGCVCAGNGIKRRVTENQLVASWKIRPQTLCQASAVFCLRWHFWSLVRTLR